MLLEKELAVVLFFIYLSLLFIYLQIRTILLDLIVFYMFHFVWFRSYYLC
jgi:hypothetical protein